MRVLALLLALAGCSTLVPSTVAQLAAVQPLEADPAAIAVALVLPAGLEVAPGSARLTVEALRRDTGVARKLDLVLEPQAAPSLPAGAVAYAIAAADLPKLRALQDEVRGWKAAGVETGGSLGLGLGGCALGDGPATDARASAFIRTEAGGPFAPLIADASLRQLLGPQVFDAIAPCAGPL